MNKPSITIPAQNHRRAKHARFVFDHRHHDGQRREASAPPPTAIASESPRSCRSTSCSWATATSEIAGTPAVWSATSATTSRHRHRPPTLRRGRVRRASFTWAGSAREIPTSSSTTSIAIPAPGALLDAGVSTQSTPVGRIGQALEDAGTGSIIGGSLIGEEEVR